MHTADAGLSLIKTSEGLDLHAYKCPAGVWTIGYGHTSAAGTPPVSEGLAITAEQAEVILRADLEAVEGAVTKAVKVILTQDQFDALVSFTFNVGAAALRGSTLLRLLNGGDHAAIPAQILRWNKSDGRVLPGLTARRHAEAALWDGLAHPPATGPMPKKVDVPRAVPPPTPPIPSALPQSQKAPSILRSLLLSVTVFFGATAASHAADVAVAPFAAATLDYTVAPVLTAVASWAGIVITNASKRWLDQQTSATLGHNLNAALTYAIGYGVKNAEQWLDREDFHFGVDGWVAEAAVAYAQAHFPALAAKAGGDLTQKVQARLAQHPDLLALKAKASA